MSQRLDSLLDAERRAECERNDAEPQPAQMHRRFDPMWRYTPADQTDVRRTWRRFGWVPTVPLRRSA